jgi:hypothetical protein
VPEPAGLLRGSAANVRVVHVIIAGLLALGSSATQAQFLYSCITADGKRISGDRPPPECANRQIRISRADGTPYGTIEPPLTPEQVKKRDDEAKRKMLDSEAARAQLQSDRSLLETYSSIEEIEAQRRRVLADLQRNLDRSVTRKSELQRDRKKLDNETEFYPKRELPEKLKRELAANNEMTKSQDKSIADTRAEMARANARFDAFAKRFKELLDRGATPVQRHPAKK